MPPRPTLAGFEPTQGNPIGLAGRRLSHSAKVRLAIHSDYLMFLHFCLCVCVWESLVSSCGVLLSQAWLCRARANGAVLLSLLPLLLLLFLFVAFLAVVAFVVFEAFVVFLLFLFESPTELQRLGQSMVSGGMAQRQRV